MTGKEVARATKALPYPDALVYSVLASFSGRDDMCAVSHKRIADACGISLSSVKLRLRRLKEAGVIGIIPGEGKPYINTFKLFRDETGESLPKSSPYGYVTVHTPCGELTELVTNDRELARFRREVDRVIKSAHKENVARIIQSG